MNAEQHSIMTDLVKGIIGFSASAIGVVTSFQGQIEWSLRIATLIVGLVVGVLTAVNLWKQIRK